MAETSGIDIQLSDILNDYEQKLGEKATKIARDVAKEAVAEVREASPVNAGRYAQGWTSKKQGKGYVVYNKTDWQLTHLLEYGHVSANRYGVYGRVRAYPHIKKVETEMNEKFRQRCEDEVQRIK